MAIEPSFVVVFALAGIIACMIGLYVWKQRSMSGNAWFALLMVMVAEWSFMDSLKAMATDPGTMFLFTKLSYIGIVATPPIWLLFTLSYSGRRHWLTPAMKIVLFALPPVTYGLIATNDLHGLVWSNVTTVSDANGVYLTYTYGVWYIFHAIYSYLLMLIGLVLLLSMFLRSYEKYRAQTAILLIGACLPLIFNVIYITGLSPLGDVDLSPIAFCVTFLMFIWGITRYRLFDILPVARETLFATMAEGVLVLDRGNIIVDVNPALKQMLGIDRSAVGQPGAAVLAKYPMLVDCCMKGVRGQAEMLEMVIDSSAGERWIDVHISPVRDSQGQCSGKVITLWDITQRKQIETEMIQNNEELQSRERELRESEERWRQLVDFLPAGIAIHCDGIVVYLNQAGMKLVGAVQAEDVVGKPVLKFVHPDSHAVMMAHVRQVMEDGLPAEQLEEKFVRVDGEIVDVEVTIMPLIYLGKKSVLSVSWDISERKRAQESIEVSLKEKELLLKEIHHRVKNNLQIISSLLSLQSGNAANEQVNSGLRESQNRIRSMALIHEKLYQSNNMARIDFKEYVQSLVASLSRTYILLPGIVVDVLIDDVSMDIDQAIPCGLIINELITNSLKYAFKGRSTGRIAVSLSQSGDRYVLSVSDDGVGLPLGFDFRSSPSLGLQLVVTLTDQLDGVIEHSEGRGTTFVIRFRGDMATEREGETLAGS